MRVTIQLLMTQGHLSLRMLTGRERNVLKKSAKISSSSRIMRFVDLIISIWGGEKKKTPQKTLMNQDCTQDEKMQQLSRSFPMAKSQHGSFISIPPSLRNSPLQYHSAYTPPAVGGSLPHRAARPVYEDTQCLERCFLLWTAFLFLLSIYRNSVLWSLTEFF